MKILQSIPSKDLKQFSKWIEKHNENEPELTDDDVVYLWDDLTVMKSPVIPDKGLLFDDVTPEWQHFCQETPKLEIPEDLRYAYEQAETQGNTSSETSDKHSEAAI